MAEVKLVGAAQAAELASALRNVSEDIADLVASELEDIAKGVVSDARAKVPHRTGAAQASYRANGTAVSMGDVPYVPWLEFGGKVGRKNSVSRPYKRGGRYLYPAISANLADIEARVDALISDATNGYLVVD